MPVTIRKLDGEPVVEAVFAGVLRPGELTASVREFVEFARQQGVDRYLSDLTTLAGGHGIVDLYGIVDLLESLGLERSLREALVVPLSDASAADAEFYETACRNRGWNVRLFPTRDVALAWLRETT